MKVINDDEKSEEKWWKNATVVDCRTESLRTKAMVWYVHTLTINKYVKFETKSIFEQVITSGEERTLLFLNVELKAWKP